MPVVRIIVLIFMRFNLPYRRLSVNRIAKKKAVFLTFFYLNLNLYNQKENQTAALRKNPTLYHAIFRMIILKFTFSHLYRRGRLFLSCSQTRLREVI